MKRLLLVLLLSTTVPVAPACVPKTIVTPAGQAAYRADQVVQRFSEISDVVTHDVGTAPGQIHAADAFTIIEWISGDAHATPPTTGLVQIIGAAGQSQGWKATALQAWTTRIKPIFQRYSTLAPYVDLVDGLLQVVL